MPPKKDVFDQFMNLGVTMSAANTLTFSEVAIGMSLFDYAAFIISRIEYIVASARLGELLLVADTLEVAVTGSNTIASLSPAQAEVYDYLGISTYVSGTPANAGWQELPIVHDYSGMAGGGLIVPAQTIYIGMDSTGFTPAGNASARVYYTVKQLQAGDFIELVQRLRVLST